jgi:hypothetical protein
MSNYIVIKKSETPAVEISICSDGIIRVMFKRNTEIGPPEFKELFEKYNSLVEGKSYPYIYFVEDSSVIFTNEGRVYSKEHEFSFPKICNAYVVTSLAHKLIANFYLKFNKPSYPSKVFTNMKNAEEWCFQQLKDSDKKHYSMVM